MNKYSDKISPKEAAIIEVERNWKFASLILGLSIGILAFSLNLKPDTKSLTIIFFYLSVWYIFLAGLSSFFRIYNLQISFTKDYMRVSGGKSQKEHLLKRIALTDVFGRFTYVSMMLCFILGISTFVFYVFLTIIEHHKIIDRLNELF